MCRELDEQDNSDVFENWRFFFEVLEDRVPFCETNDEQNFDILENSLQHDSFISVTSPLLSSSTKSNSSLRCLASYNGYAKICGDQSVSWR